MELAAGAGVVEINYQINVDIVVRYSTSMYVPHDGDVLHLLRHPEDTTLYRVFVAVYLGPYSHTNTSVRYCINIPCIMYGTTDAIQTKHSDPLPVSRRSTSHKNQNDPLGTKAVKRRYFHRLTDGNVRIIYVDGRQTSRF